MKKHYLIPIAGMLALGACSTTQIQTATAAVQALVADACKGAQTAQAQAALVVKGGAANTVANLGAYVAGACASASTIAAVAADPTTTAWLGDLQGQFKALTSIATGATPAPVATAPATAS